MRTGWWSFLADADSIAVSFIFSAVESNGAVGSGIARIGRWPVAFPDMKNARACCACFTGIAIGYSIASADRDEFFCADIWPLLTLANTVTIPFGFFTEEALRTINVVLTLIRWIHARPIVKHTGACGISYTIIAVCISVTTTNWKINSGTNFRSGLTDTLAATIAIFLVTKSSCWAISI